jgi:hypothetical protein
MKSEKIEIRPSVFIARWKGGIITVLNKQTDQEEITGELEL